MEALRIVITAYEGERSVEMCFPLADEEDPDLSQIKVGEDALLSVVTALVEFGFIRGRRKGGVFVEEDF